MKNLLSIIMLIFLINTSNVLSNIDNYFDFDFINADYFSMCVANDNQVFLCGMPGSIMVSNDKGSTWNKCPAYTDMPLISIDAKGKTAIAVGLLGKIRYSNDGGQKWYINDSVTSFLLNSVILFDSQTGCIFGASGLILKTTDGGKNWKNIITEISDDIVSAVLTKTNKILIATNSGKLFNSTDYGENWFAIDIGIETFTPKNFSYSKDSIIYLLTDKNLKKSIDNGETWTNLLIPYKNINNCYYTTNGKGYFTSNNLKIYRTDDDNLYKDSLNLSKLMTPDINGYLKSISFYNDNVGFAVGSNNLIFKTIDGGYNWELLSYLDGYAPSTFQNIVFLNDSLGFVTNSNANLFKTTNNGITWKRIIPSDSNSIFEKIGNIYFYNENEWVFTTTSFIYHVIIRTTDGGKTFSQDTIQHSKNIYYGDFPCLFHLFDDSFLISGASLFDNDIFHSYFAIKILMGNIWNRIDKDSILVSPYILNSENLFAYGYMQDSSINHITGMEYDRGLILHSFDTAKTWKFLIFNEVDEIRSMKFIDNSLGYAIGYKAFFDSSYNFKSQKSYLYQTTDLGINWKLLDSFNKSIGITFFKNKYGFLFTTDTILFSLDNGYNWVYGTKNSKMVYSKNSVTDSCIYLIGLQNQFYPTLMRYKLKNDLTSVEVNNYVIEIAFPSALIFKPYPIPASEYVKFDIIWSILYSPLELHFKIYNIYGEEIIDPDIELNITSVNTGTVKWNIEHIYHGIYFFQLEVGNYKSAQKVLVY